MRKILLIFITLLLPFSNAERIIDFDNLDYEAEIIQLINQDPVYIDLRECIYLALINNAYLKSRKSLYDSKNYEYKYSFASLLPDAGLQGYTRIIKGQLLVGGALIEDLNEVALYGGLWAQYDVTGAVRNIFEILSRKNLKLAQHYDFTGTRQELLYKTASGYYELMLTKLIVQNLLIALKDRTYQLEIAKARYEAGEAEKLDVIRSEVEVQETKINLIGAVNDLQVKQTQLARIIGVDSYSPLFPIEKEIKEYTLTKNLTQKEIIDNAMVVVPKIKEMEEQISSLKKQRGKLYMDIVPNVTLDYEASYQGTVRLGLLPNTTFLANVNIPLGDKLYVGTWAKIKALSKEIESKEYELSYLKTEVRENIIISFFNSERSRKEIIENKKQHEMTKKAAEIATAKYLEGIEEIINVINAQTNKTQTMINLSSNKLNYNLHQLSILYHAGIISADNILNGYNP